LSSATLRSSVVLNAFCSLPVIGAPRCPRQQRQNQGPPEAHLTQIVPEEAHEQERQTSNGQETLKRWRRRRGWRSQTFYPLGATAQGFFGNASRTADAPDSATGSSGWT
jgi:hypothetical protein